MAQLPGVLRTHNYKFSYRCQNALALVLDEFEKRQPGHIHNVNGFYLSQGLLMPGSSCFKDPSVKDTGVHHDASVILLPREWRLVRRSVLVGFDHIVTDAHPKVESSLPDLHGKYITQGHLVIQYGPNLPFNGTRQMFSFVEAAFSIDDDRLVQMRTLQAKTYEWGNTRVGMHLHTGLVSLMADIYTHNR